MKPINKQIISNSHLRVSELHIYQATS